MEDKKNETPCEQEHKKVSKRYLAFYVIGLFCVALVLILLSYVTQLRADRQLASMNSELAQKDTTVQGVQEKVVMLQQTVEEQKNQLDKAQNDLKAIRTELGIGEDEELLAALQQQLDERDAFYEMALLENAVAVEDTQTIQTCMEYLESIYGSGRLDGTAENAVFTGAMADRYLEIKEQYQ